MACENLFRKFLQPPVAGEHHLNFLAHNLGFFTVYDSNLPFQPYLSLGATHAPPNLPQCIHTICLSCPQTTPCAQRIPSDQNTSLIWENPVHPLDTNLNIMCSTSFSWQFLAKLFPFCVKLCLHFYYQLTLQLIHVNSVCPTPQLDCEPLRHLSSYLQGLSNLNIIFSLN